MGILDEQDEDDKRLKRELLRDFRPTLFKINKNSLKYFKIKEYFYREDDDFFAKLQTQARTGLQQAHSNLRAAEAAYREAQRAYVQAIDHAENLGTLNPLEALRKREELQGGLPLRNDISEMPEYILKGKIKDPFKVKVPFKGF